MTEETKIYNPDSAWEDAENPTVVSETIWGKVYVHVNQWYFPGGGATPEPYNPQNPAHALKKPATKISMQIAYLPEMMLSFEQKLELYTFSDDYRLKVLPSIAKLNLTKDGKGFLKALNEKWVKVERVDGLTPNRKNPERGNYKTWEFQTVFPDEEACRKDYAAIWNIDGKPWDEETPEPESSQSPNSKKIETALLFAKAFVDEACEIGKGNRNVIVGYLEGKFAQNPDVGNYLKVDSPEVNEMIDDWLPKELR